MKFKTIALAVFSPTRLIIHYRKNRAGSDRAEMLKKWNLKWFQFEVGAFILLWILYPWIPIKAASGFGLAFVYVGLWLVPFSRCNEITCAFYTDSLDKLGEASRPPSLSQQPAVAVLSEQSGIALVDRIQMLIRSYAGLTLNFAFICFFLPSSMYDTPIHSPIDALYFSGVTIATLGYGDIKPMHEVSRFLAVYEVLSGILLFVLALAVYVSRPPEKAV